MDDFAGKIQNLRSKLRLSQEELATRLDVSFATVNRWEAGKSRPQRAQREAVEQMLVDAGVEADSSTPPDTSPTTRRRRGVSHSKVLGTRSMEQMLWDAACSIRGEKDAPKFKDYILPLLFIKRLSDVFDDELSRLAEQFGDRETALALVEEEAKGTTQPGQRLVRLYIPPEARWSVVSGRVAFDWPADRRPRTLGEQLTLTTRAIVRHNPGLAGVIDVVDFNETRNGEREISDSALKGVIETFSDPRYRLGLHNVEPDFLGRCYEYLLRKFAEGSGQSAGEFFTPTEVGLLMAEILRPRPGEECYDYACGSFGLLVKLQLVCRRLDPMSKVPLRLSGQELQAESYAIACMNRIIHDMQGDVVRGDSMRNPKFREADTRLKEFDIVVANPMWNQPFDPDVYENDSFGRFEEQGGSTAGKADWAWLQHTSAAMKEGGRAAVVLDTGAVTRGSGGKNEDRERSIRRWFVEHDLIDAVILLPKNLFYNTSAAGVIVVLRKQKTKERRGKVVLIDASSEFREGSPKNYLTPEGIRRIADAYSTALDTPGIARVVTIDEVISNDFNLLPARYVTGAQQSVESTSLPDLVVRSSTVSTQTATRDADLSVVIQNLREVRPTEPLPTGWRLSSLRDINQSSVSNLDPGDHPEESFEYYSIPAYQTGAPSITRGASILSQKQLIPARCVLFGKLNPRVEKVWFVDSHSTYRRLASTEWFVLNPIAEVDLGFLYFLLWSEWVMPKAQSLVSGSTPSRERVDPRAFYSIEIPVPPLDEQRRIAGVLWRLKGAVDLDEQRRILHSTFLKTLLPDLVTGRVAVVERSPGGSGTASP
jgi:type I restriction enzyme M protein